MEPFIPEERSSTYARRQLAFGAAGACVWGA